MYNKFVLDNFDPVVMESSLHKGVPDRVLCDDLLTLFSSPESEDVTHQMKKSYATLLLTGCVIETSEYNRGAMKDISCVDMKMARPVAVSIGAMLPGFESVYDLFSFCFQLMRSSCPDLLHEIIREQYERIMPGYIGPTSSCMHAVMQRIEHSQNFYQPIVKDILVKYAGREVRYDAAADSPLNRYVHAAVDGLLRFGKIGYFGLGLSHVMACIGVYTKCFPDILDEKLKVVSEIFSKNMSGNGLESVHPSMSEMAHIINLIELQCKKRLKLINCHLTGYVL